MKKLSVCLGLLLLNASYAQSMFKGSEGGGGGDASEERVSEIRADILSWINKGGSKGLILPEGVSLNEYNQKMSELLQSKAVVVTFVTKDDPKDEELQVNVDGKPKTCRGFFSRRDARPHVLCDIARFKETSPSEQYKLIHHEYAGLAYLEKNEGSASDYILSNQITDFLEEVKVLKLAVKATESYCTAGLNKTNNNKFLMISFNRSKSVEVTTHKQTFENNLFEILSSKGCSGCQTQFQLNYNSKSVELFSVEGDIHSAELKISSVAGDQIKLKKSEDIVSIQYRGKWAFEKTNAEILLNGKKLYDSYCFKKVTK